MARRLIDYPRARKRGLRRWLPSARLVLGTLLTFVVLGLGAFAVAYAKVAVPDPNKLVTANASVVTWSDGKTELGRFSEVNRQSVPLSEVSEDAQHAVLAAEDRSFYENKGVSPKGIGRAVYVKLTGGSTQGGSTITQQYVKNYFLTADRTASRKAREFVISLKIERQESKDVILQNYLNTIYFGRGSYGVQTASQAYFGRDAAKLSLSQSALLAAVIRSPGLYDPVAEKQRAVERWNYVLDGMVAEGWATPEERAKAKFPKVIKRKATNQLGGTKGYLLETVRAELKSRAGLTDADIDQGGLKVVSTFSKKAQDAAVEAIRDDMPTSDAKGVRVGLTAVRPGDGAVVAMYGGKDYVKQAQNAATQLQMQAGSTFKPFALAAALEDGVSVRSRFDGGSPRRFDGFQVSNFGGEQFGSIDLVTATEHSVNTVYAALNEQIGPKKTRQAALDAGYPKDTPGLEANPVNVLGSASPHVLDVANAYATFASLGERATPYTVKSVTGPDGKRTYKADVRTERAFSKDSMRDLTYALQGVVRQGTGAYAGSNLGRPAAGKTGTSSSSKSAWFAGYTPQLSAAVGMVRTGTKDGKSTELSLNGLGGVSNVTGGAFGVRIWTDFMKAALEGSDVQQFEPPAFGGRSNVPTRTSTSTSTSSATTAETPTEPATPTQTPTETATQTQEPTQTQQPTPTVTAPTVPTPTLPVPTRTQTPKPTEKPTGDPTQRSTQQPAATP